MAKITEIKTKIIFDSTCQTLVNTVNCDGVMGRGIALEYKYRFPKMYGAYAEVCEKKLLKPGLLYIYKESKPWILNFPTKVHWKYPSKIEYLELGLKKFTETYLDKKITSIAFPQLGASLGGLQWEDVKSLMYQYLEPLNDIDIEIYHSDHKAKDSLFDRLCLKIHKFEPGDYKRCLDINEKQALLLTDAFNSQNINTMLELQNINGLGEKTFEKIYKYESVNNNKKKSSNTREGEQLLFNLNNIT